MTTTTLHDEMLDLETKFWQSIKDRDTTAAQRATADPCIVAYRVHEDLIVDDEPVSMDAADASVWVRTNGVWKCALHTESLIGDAYGRDRKPRVANGNGRSARLESHGLVRPRRIP